MDQTQIVDRTQGMNMILIGGHAQQMDGGSKIESDSKRGPASANGSGSRNGPDSNSESGSANESDSVNE